MCIESIHNGNMPKKCPPTRVEEFILDGLHTTRNPAVMGQDAGPYGPVRPTGQKTCNRPTKACLERSSIR